MTAGRWPWNVLGIEPTDDTRSIRRAYAALLKAGDYDTDAAGFARLRDARDAALHEAEHGPPEPVEAWQPDPAAFAMEPPPVLHEDGEALLDTDAEWRSPPPAEDDAFDRHARRLEQALFAARDTLPDGAEVAAMRLDLDALLADSRMEDVTTYAQVEEGIAHVFASTSPVSDPLIERATAYFGWDAREDDIHALPAVTWLMQHRRTLVFREALQRPGHRLARAWRELTTPASEKSRRSLFIRRGKVRELLELIRRDHPALEGELDSWRVALWERKGSLIIEPWILWLLVIGCIQLLNFCASAPAPVAPPLLPRLEDVLTNAPADLDAALQRAAPEQSSFAQLEMLNPTLTGALRGRWAVASANGETRTAFIDGTSQFLLAEAFGRFDEADYDLVADWRRWQRDAARAAPLDEACVRVFTHYDPAIGLARDGMIARRTALIFEALKHVDGLPDPVREPSRFNVPGPIVKRTQVLSGLSLDRLRAAFVGKGTPAEECRADIALIEAALEAPAKQGLPVLRGL